MGRREEERGGRPRARGWPFAAHVVRRFSESAPRKVATQSVKLGTTFYNLLSARSVADRLVRVNTRGLRRPPGWPSAQGDQSPICRPPVDIRVRVPVDTLAA